MKLNCCCTGCPAKWFVYLILFPFKREKDEGSEWVFLPLWIAGITNELQAPSLLCSRGKLSNNIILKYWPKSRQVLKRLPHPECWNKRNKTLCVYLQSPLMFWSSPVQAAGVKWALKAEQPLRTDTWAIGKSACLAFEVITPWYKPLNSTYQS